MPPAEGKCLASWPIAVAAQMQATSASSTASGSACWASGTEMYSEYATAAAGAMCVIDWNSTCGRPIECSRRCSKLRGVLAASIPIPPRSLTGDHGPFAGRIAHALLDPRVAAVQHGHRGLVSLVVVVGPQVVEQRVRAAAGLAAEQVAQLARRVAALGLLGGDRVGVHDRGGDGEQLGADVHDPPEERLALLEPGLPARHRVERRTGQPARGALYVAHARGELHAP